MVGKCCCEEEADKPYQSWISKRSNLYGQKLVPVGFLPFQPAHTGLKAQLMKKGQLTERRKESHSELN